MTYRASRGRLHSDRLRKRIRIHAQMRTTIRIVINGVVEALTSPSFREELQAAFTRVKAQLNRPLNDEERISFVAGNLAIDDSQGRPIEFWNETARKVIQERHAAMLNRITPLASIRIPEEPEEK